MSYGTSTGCTINNITATDATSCSDFRNRCCFQHFHIEVYNLSIDYYSQIIPDRYSTDAMCFHHSLIHTGNHLLSVVITLDSTDELCHRLHHNGICMQKCHSHHTTSGFDGMFRMNLVGVILKINVHNPIYYTIGTCRKYKFFVNYCNQLYPFCCRQ